MVRTECVSRPRLAWDLSVCSIVLLGALLAEGAEAASDAWYSVGPEGGTVTELLFDPDTASHVYAAGEFRTLFESVDGGLSWTLRGGLEAGDANSTLESLVAVPRIPGVLYAFTDSVLRSEDAGTTWRVVGLRGGVPDGSPYELAVSPSPGLTLYLAAGTRGVFRSYDGGSSWQDGRDGLEEFPASGSSSALYYPAITLSPDPRRPATLLVGTSRGGVFRSEDDGRHWMPARTGMESRDVSRLARHPRVPTTLYAVAEWLYRSDDDGERWWNAGEMCGRWRPPLALDPFDPRTIYCGASNELRKSSEAGANWQTILTSSRNEIRAVAVSPLAPRLVLASIDNEGLYQSSDGGLKWNTANRGLTATSVLSLRVAEGSPDTLYVSLLDRSVATSTDGGASWRVVWPAAGVPSEWVEAIGVASRDSTHVVIASGGRVFASSDGGASWHPASFEPSAPEGPFAYEFQWAMQDANLVYALTSKGVYRSDDGGGNWVAANAGLCNPEVPPSVFDPNSCREMVNLAVDPFNGDRVYAVHSERGVFVTADGGASWSHLSGELAGYATIVTHPGVPGLLFAFETYSLGVFRSDDSGQHWERISAATRGLRVRGLAVDPVDPATLYVTAENAGVLRSVDGGKSWCELNEGLPTLPVVGLVLSGTSHRLYVQTWGAGVCVRETPGGDSDERGRLRRRIPSVH